MTRLCCALGVASILLAAGGASPALAGPPYAVDDPGTAGHHTLLLYTAYQGNWGDGSSSFTFPQFTAAYGARPNLELSVGISGFTSNVPAPQHSLLLTDPAFAVKWRFWEETPHSPALALGYQTTLATEEEGAGPRSFTHSLWLTGSRSLGRGLLWSNVGVNLYPGSGLASSTYYGLTYDYPLSRHLRLGTQVYGHTAATQAEVSQELAWGVGATYSLSRNMDLLAQGGRSLRDGQDYNVYLGVLVQLPRK